MEDRKFKPNTDIVKVFHSENYFQLYEVNFNLKSYIYKIEKSGKSCEYLGKTDCNGKLKNCNNDTRSTSVSKNVNHPAVSRNS